MFDKHEKKIIRQIRKEYAGPGKIYMFWFVYDNNNQAINWEGGWDLPTNNLFRNEYSIEDTKPIYKTKIGYNMTDKQLIQAKKRIKKHYGLKRLPTEDEVNAEITAIKRKGLDCLPDSQLHLAGMLSTGRYPIKMD